MKRSLLALLFLGLLSLTLAEKPAGAADLSFVPESLQEWIPWVKRLNPEIDCPLIQESDRPCSWGSVLKLDLNASGGNFEQTWEVYAQDFVPLPGNESAPPLQITVNGQPAAYVLKEGMPVLQLARGSYQVKGQFSWKGLPESLVVDPDIGLIALSMNGSPVNHPNREEGGHLWLVSRGGSEQEEGDELSIDVYRKLADGIPLNLTTVVQLKVSGKNRELKLPAFLPQGFIPLSLSSTLPAKIEPEGQLSLQLRPGDYRVEIIARHPSNTAEIEVPKIGEPWPASEIWVWSANTVLRQADLEGLRSVDPQQTTLPEEWRGMAAFLAEPGQKLAILEKSRGLSAARSDQLTLNKTLWLDFSGDGLTVKDDLSGTLNNGFRLDADPKMKLGRVSVGGMDQLITQTKDGREGVEVRDRNLVVNAESRIEGAFLGLSASGWARDFDQVDAVLNLPPGWRLLAGVGVDQASPSWAGQWTLMDFFLILIVTIGVYKLFGRIEALIALFTLVLTYHEPEAPDYLWPVLLVIAALHHYARGNSLWARFVRLTRWAMVIFLIVWLIPFSVHQLRVGMHPILEHPYGSLDGTQTYPGSTGGGFDDVYKGAAAPEAMPPPNVEANIPQPAEEADSGRYSKKGSYPVQQQSQNIQQQNLNRADPKAKVQTGRGLASWKWNAVFLNWSGPVAQDHRISLLLLSPPLNFILSVLRVLSSLLLVYVFLGLPLSSLRSHAGRLSRKSVAPVLAALCLFPAAARAEDYPDATLLETLKSFVEQSPLCLPECAEMEKASLQIKADQWVLKLKVNAMALSGFPLPSSKDWTLNSVLLDQKPAPLHHEESGWDWVAVSPGTHEVELNGTLRDKGQATVSFARTPLIFETNLEGWAQEGIDEEGRLSGTLVLSRLGAAAPSDGTGGDQLQQELSPFVRVERELYFGLEWEVLTRVTREGRTGAAVVIEYPLLEGEYILGDEPKVSGGRARIVIQPQDREVSFSSRLNIRETVELKAAETETWVESWKIMSSPVWNVEAQGIPAVARAANSGELYRFNPWPGEGVTLQMSRPSPVEGPTMAMDRVILELKAGQRAMDAHLSFDIRSSLAGIHEIGIPAGAKISSIRVNGVEEPLSAVEGRIRLGVKPGSQSYSVAWSEPEGMSLFMKSPSVDLGMPHVNAATHVSFSVNRWILKTGGRGYGPVMLFWSYLGLLFLAGWILTKVPYNFLKLHEWFLLGLGLTQVSAGEAVILALWFLCLSYRDKHPTTGSNASFNLRQIGIVFMTLIAVSILLSAIHQGLLGMPEMQILGNGSSATNLRWFMDRAGKEMSGVWILSVPLWIYRVFMLLWALWLANAFIRWVRFGWNSFTKDGAWKKSSPIAKPTK